MNTALSYKEGFGELENPWNSSNNNILPSTKLGSLASNPRCRRGHKRKTLNTGVAANYTERWL
jgi:hypothetical protein